jgi:N6-adenosine-specific RNA methylase IME4
MLAFPCDKRYDRILADPPWQYNDASKNRGGAARHYRTMSLDDIAALPVSSITAPDCILFLWSTWPMLLEGAAHKVIKSWGFDPRSCGFNWIKVYPWKPFTGKPDTDKIKILKYDENGNMFESTPFVGMGHYTRSNSEVCIVARKGHPKRLYGGVSQIIISEHRAHSQKPSEQYGRIVQMLGDIPKIELFARNSWPGWDCWGLEAPETEATE